MKYELQKNVPIPDRQERKCGLTAMCRTLDIGDSFFYPAENPSHVSGVVRNLKPHGLFFTTRKLQENDVRGFRIWRIENPKTMNSEDK